MYDYEAKVVNVVDGDTFDATVKLGFHVTTLQRFRMLFINAPEMHGAAKSQGQISKDYLTRRLLGRDIVLQSFKPDVEIDTDSFGRWLAVVYLREDTGEETDINDEMVKLGYAVPFMTKK